MQHLEAGTVVRFSSNPLGYLNQFAIVVKHDCSGCVFLQTEGSMTSWWRVTKLASRAIHLLSR